MQTAELVAAIDEEIGRLERARALLAGSGTGSVHREHPAGSFSGFGESGTPLRKRRGISAAGRARIAAAQKARWAKVKQAARRAATGSTAKPKTRKAAKRAASGDVKSRKKVASGRTPAKVASPAGPTPAPGASAS